MPFFTVAIVVLLQALIYHYGGVGEALPQYKHCLSDTLQMAINCSEKANWSNVTIPVRELYVLVNPHTMLSVEYCLMYMMLMK